MAENIYPIRTKVSAGERAAQRNQRPSLIWFTGLSGSGKSTLAVQLEAELFSRGFGTYLLDGDNVRHGLNKDLGFGEADRVENIRRLGEVCKLFLDAGVVTLASFISPFRADRGQVRGLVGAENFIEVFVDCPVEICEQRDVKGLYRKARTGEILHFTGITSPYEPPLAADIVLKSHEMPLADCIDLLLDIVLPRISLNA